MSLTPHQVNPDGTPHATFSGDIVYKKYERVPDVRRGEIKYTETEKTPYSTAQVDDLHSAELAYYGNDWNIQAKTQGRVVFTDENGNVATLNGKIEISSEPGSIVFYHYIDEKQ